MKEHNFTPEQSEDILNAVYNLIDWDDSVTPYLKYLNDQFIDQLDSLVDSDENNEGEREILITGKGFLDLSFRHRMLSDFFFRIDEIIESKTTLNSKLTNPDPKSLILENPKD
jgi:hypothetical protein